MARKVYKHVTAAKKYARSVFNGRKLAGEYERLACQRFLRDLERKDIKFDAAKANRACNFIEKFKHTKGKWASTDEDIKLQPWQSFIVCSIFGFVNLDGTRRFTEAYIRVARKNGKSLLAAGIGLYMFVEDGEFGAEVYSGATSEKQAWEVFRPARLMALRHPIFADYYGVDINAKNLNCIADDARFEPMIGNPGDGASPSCAIIDEYHEHKTSDMYETMVTGMASREQPLVLIITTAGSNIASPCFEKDDDVKTMLRGDFENDSLFGIIFAADDDDAQGSNWLKVGAMKKANPNLDVSVSRRYLERRQQNAMRSPADQAAYKTKHLNIWVGSGQAFLNTLEWDKCARPGLKVEDLVGKSCIFGIDLASRIDVVAVMRMFYEKADDENLRYYFSPRFFLPEKRIEEDQTGFYRKWADEGWLELHDDDEIDFAKLRQSIIDDATLCKPTELAYDPWRAAGLEQELSQKGFTMVKIAQTIASFTSPMNELQAAHLSGRIVHDGNPVMRWMIGNLVCKEDTNGNKKPRREIAKNKIDGPVAALMAMNRAMAQPKNGLDDWLRSLSNG